MNAARAHLEAAELMLLEAAAQARLDQDRAIHQSATTGQMRPVVTTSERLAGIQACLAQVKAMLDPGRQSDG